MIAAKLQGIRVDEFSIGFPPRIASVQIGETRYSIGLILFGGYVNIYGEGQIGNEKISPGSYVSLGLIGKIFILLAGVVANYLLSCIIFSYLLSRGIVLQIKYYLSTESDQILDTLPYIPGRYAHWIRKITNIAPDYNICEIKQNDETAPPTYALEIQGDFFLKARFGEIFFTCLNPWNMLVIINIVGLGLQPRAQFKTKEKEGISGPIAILRAFGTSTKNGPEHLAFFTAQISFFIAVFNILPIPPLDGGKILMLLIGPIIGEIAVIIISLIGFLAFLCLFIYTIFKDLR